MNKFAVILATIGRESLPEAINSVLAQSYKEWNLIVSYDWHEAYKVLLTGEWVPDDCRIIHISPGNETPSNDSGAAARNYAMQFVPTDCNWICYLDDDDIWYPNRLQVVNDFIENNNYGNLGALYTYADLFKLKHKSPRKSEKFLKQVGIVTNVTCGGMFHTPEAFKKTNGWNPKNKEDHDRELYEEMIKHVGHNIIEVPTFQFIWR